MTQDNVKDDIQNGGENGSDNGLQGESKEYDGSRSPMVIIPNLNSSLVIDKALGRIQTRLNWIKARRESLFQEWEDTATRASRKAEIRTENDKLKSDLPKLRDKGSQLREKLKKVEEKELEKLKGYDFGSLDL